MNRCQQTVRRCLLFFLCLVAYPSLTTARRPPARGQSTHGGSALERWEKIYADPGGTSFKAVYSSAMRLRKISTLSWLWVGDADGFVRLAALDPDSSLLLGPQRGVPTPYIGLSRLEVSDPGEGGEQARAPVNALAFLDEGFGYLLKGNSIYVTEDAGFSWRPTYRVGNLPDGSTATLFSIFVTPSKRACVVGWYSRFKKPTDSLVLCSAKSLEHDNPQWGRAEGVPRQTQLFNVHFFDNRRGWIVGTKGTILKTEDGGKVWKLVRTGTEALLQVYFVDEENGWAVGRLGTLLRSEDGGRSWDAVKEVYFNRGVSNVTLRSVGFTPDKANGWIVGEQGTILHTDDEGDSWRQQKSPPTDPGGRAPDLNALFVDKNICWAVGESGNVWRYRLR